MIQEDLPKIVKLAKSIESGASICVKCGLCLEHCPTYLRTHDENESPRGRIALLQAVANETITANDTLKEHIDHCLTCRACETVCPAYVPYGNIIDSGRTLLNEKKVQIKKPLTARFMQWLIAKPSRIKKFHKTLWLLQKSGVRTVAQLLGIPKLFGVSHLDNILGKIQKPHQLEDFYPSLDNNLRGNIGLFVGCMHSWLEQKPVFDAIKVLTTLGFNIHIPKNQGCCGAMSRHEGLINDAIKMGQSNIKAFKELDLDYITYLPSGCGCELKTYAKLLSQSKLRTNADDFSKKIFDILTIIQKTNCLEDTPIAGFKERKTVFVHSPCTMKHHLKQKDPALEILPKIPNLNVVPFSTQTCCGAAGNHMIKHPSIALDYLSPYMYELNDIHADFIASSNIGCALHFKQGLKHFSKRAAIVHPVSLLAAAIGSKKNG
jgi:glycolate oxidase iron-sulfur subunit